MHGYGEKTGEMCMCGQRMEALQSAEISTRMTQGRWVAVQLVALYNVVAVQEHSDSVFNTVMAL